MNVQKTVLVLLPLDAAEKQELEAMAPHNSYLYPEKADLTQEMIMDSHVILGSVPVAGIAGSDKLEWLQLSSAGAREYVISGQFPEQAVLTNAAGAYGLAISEHMLAMLLMIQKKLYLYHRNKLSSTWQSEGGVTSIDGATTVVVGLGDIGREFARRMKLLGSQTIGVKRHPADRPPYVDELHLIAELDQLLPRADVVALSLPDTDETYQIMNRKRLAAMKKTAILLNVGRGRSVDTEALCDLMEEGHLLGAGLDVTDPEPLPADHRLWKIPNALITPHVSGGYSLIQTRRRIARIALDNYARYLRGETLDKRVDFRLGY
ncbi:MAG: D-2-hydroxyacid dehydrogenase [Ruminococcaceae bacterium]|nr:D-2-hydroxyacid dehydrogenase [Oscillospiraceae bacterium]